MVVWHVEEYNSGIDYRAVVRGSSIGWDLLSSRRTLTSLECRKGVFACRIHKCCGEEYVTSGGNEQNVMNYECSHGAGICG